MKDPRAGAPTYYESPEEYYDLNAGKRNREYRHLDEEEAAAARLTAVQKRAKFLNAPHVLRWRETRSSILANPVKYLKECKERSERVMKYGKQLEMQATAAATTASVGPPEADKPREKKKRRGRRRKPEQF